MVPQQKGGMLQAPVSGRKKRRQTRRKPKKALSLSEITEPTKVVNSKVPGLALRNMIDHNHGETVTL